MKKNVSTQTNQATTNENCSLINSHFTEKNKTYEKLKKCLYPDLFDCQIDKNGIH